MVKEFNVTAYQNLAAVTGFVGDDIIPMIRKNATTGAVEWVRAPGSLLAGSSFVDWTSNTNYSVGAMIIYNGALWKVNAAFTSGSTFDGTNLTQLTPNFSIDPTTKNVVFNNTILNDPTLISATIDSLTKVASTWENALNVRSLAQRLDMFADIRDWGVQTDTDGKLVDNNTDYLLKAISDTAGVAQLHIPKGVQLVVNPLVIPQSNVALKLDGVIQLAGNSAASTSVKANLIELQGSNVFISGSGILDGNRANQTWTTGQVVGGITSNTWQTTATELVDPTTATAKPISNIFISGITIQNVGAWPISLGYVTNAHINKVNITESGASPQFFASADNCSVTQCNISNITGTGWNCYVGNRNVSVLNNTITNCYNGITVYSESDARTGSSDILVGFNTITQCRDSAISFVTGGTNPTPIQSRCTALANRCTYNNTGGNKGTFSIGVVGCINPSILLNEVFGDGIEATGANSGQGFYSDQTTTGLILEGNTFDSIGSKSHAGTGVVIYDTQNAIIRDNVVRDSQGVMSVAFNGVLGSNCVVGGNIVSPSFTGAVWNLEPASDTVIDRQRISLNGPVISTGGETFKSGYVALSSSLFTAAGSTTADATVITAQSCVIAAGTGGVRLPSNVDPGTVITITNGTTSPVNIYPSTGTKINTSKVDIPIVLNAGISGQYTLTAAGVWVSFIPLDVRQYLALMSPQAWTANTAFVAPQLVYYHDPDTGTITLYSCTKNFMSGETFDDTNLNAIISSPPTASEMRMFYGGTPTAGQTVGAFIASQSGQIKENFVGGNAAILTKPTAPFVLTVNLNGVAIGTITFRTDGTSTMVCPQTNVNANDVITVIAPTTVDATAAGIVINFSLLNT